MIFLCNDLSAIVTRKQSPKFFQILGANHGDEKGANPDLPIKLMDSSNNSPSHGKTCLAVGVDVAVDPGKLLGVAVERGLWHRRQDWEVDSGLA